MDNVFYVCLCAYYVNSGAHVEKQTWMSVFIFAMLELGLSAFFCSRCQGRWPEAFRVLSSGPHLCVKGLGLKSLGLNVWFPGRFWEFKLMSLHRMFPPMDPFLHLKLTLNHEQVIFVNHKYQVIELVLTTICKSTAIAVIVYKVSDDLWWPPGIHKP